MTRGADVLIKQPARKETPTTFLLITLTGKSESGKTSIWTIRDSKWHMLLGIVQWYFPWRCYVFAPQPAVIFSVSCLDEIAAFLKDARPDHGE